MTVSPLAMGLITGASQVEDPVVERVLNSMLTSANEDELRRALLDLTGVVVALAKFAEIQHSDLVDVVS